MSIAEFLLARIAEDEAVARERPSSAYVHASGCYYYNYSLDVNWFCDCDEDGESSARILAECAAKRSIVNLYEGHRGNRDARRRARDTEDEQAAQDRRTQEARTRVAEDALYALAAVYKDHPDYREEWAA